MKCYRCNGTGTIQVAEWYNSNPPDWAYGPNDCWRCYGSGYL